MKGKELADKASGEGQSRQGREEDGAAEGEERISLAESFEGRNVVTSLGIPDDYQDEEGAEGNDEIGSEVEGDDLRSECSLPGFQATIGRRMNPAWAMEE